MWKADFYQRYKGNYMEKKIAISTNGAGATGYL